MPSPFFVAYDSISTPNGTWIKPGGQVVAYVRSTGVQSGDLSPIADNLVATIAAGVNKCRPGMNDVVVVLPGHTENVATTLFTPVAGAQIVGAGLPGAANAPNVTLTTTASTIALSAANMSLIGLNINSTVAAITGAIVVTGAGVTIANCFINFTGALGANPGIAVTAAANFTFDSCHFVCSSTVADPLIEITGASTNFLIRNSIFRQLVTGNYVTSAAATSGHVVSCYGKTAGATPAAGAGFVLLPVTASGCYDSFTSGNAAASSTIATGA